VPGVPTGALPIAERAEAIGGRLAVHAAAGEGTTLRVVVPVAQRPEEPPADAPPAPPPAVAQPEAAL
jgi:hypothetical protein